MDTLSIIKRNSGRPVSFIDTFRFAKEDNLVKFGRIDADMFGAVVVELIEDIVV